MTKNVTKEEVKAALEILTVVAGLIRELGTVPAGHLYAQLADKMDLAGFEKMIGILVDQGFVKRYQSGLLQWMGE